MSDFHSLSKVGTSFYTCVIFFAILLPCQSAKVVKSALDEGKRGGAAGPEMKSGLLSLAARAAKSGLFLFWGVRGVLLPFFIRPLVKFAPKADAGGDFGRRDPRALTRSPKCHGGWRRKISPRKPDNKHLKPFFRVQPLRKFLSRAAALIK